MDEYNEEELLYLIRGGNETAQETLYKKYYLYITNWVKPYCHYSYLGLDKDDFIQIGMMCFQMSLDSYRSDRSCNLYAYVKTSVMRKVVNAIVYLKNDSIYRHGYVLSLDDQIYGDDENVAYGEIIADSKETYQPQNRFMIKERTKKYRQDFHRKTSPQEKTVVLWLQKGYSAQEIASEMDISLKSVYNAIYRCRRKCKPLTKKNKYVKL